VHLPSLSLVEGAFGYSAARFARTRLLTSTRVLARTPVLAGFYVQSLVAFRLLRLLPLFKYVPGYHVTVAKVQLIFKGWPYL
jgi:hypothetical protein